MIYWHFGKPYRHVSRIARKGEKVVVLNKDKHGMDYEVGDIFTVEGISWDRCCVNFRDNAREHNWMHHREYLVLEEVDPAWPQY